MAKKRSSSSRMLVPVRRKRGILRAVLRALLQGVVLGTVALLCLWFAVHRVSWLGPAIADTLRSVLGPAVVARLEDVAYGIQDKVNLWRYRDAKPTKFWEAPATTAAPDLKKPTVDPPGFFPAPFAVPYAKVASTADGIWIPVADPRDEDATYSVFKSMVHPDRRRPFAALAVVVIDLSAFELHLVAGTREPKSYRVHRKDRPGLIPAADAKRLFAAFNGGFKATHGNYGMFLGGVEYLPPRKHACTFARYRDGSFRIAPFGKLKAEVKSMTYYRQTPPCLVEDGKVHSLLHYHEYAKGWGATVSGETVIRRSAIGLGPKRNTLFYGLGEAMTAQALAHGMKAAGAHWVAELDVNHSYPRFLFYNGQGSSPRVMSAIIPGIDYEDDQYVKRSSVRDFFYLTRSSKTAMSR